MCLLQGRGSWQSTFGQHFLHKRLPVCGVLSGLCTGALQPLTSGSSQYRRLPRPSKVKGGLMLRGRAAGKGSSRHCQRHCLRQPRAVDPQGLHALLSAQAMPRWLPTYGLCVLVQRWCSAVRQVHSC